MTQSRLVLACVITCVATVVGLGGQDGNPDLFNETCCAPSRPGTSARSGCRRAPRPSPSRMVHPKSISTRSTSRPGLAVFEDHQRRRDVHTGVRSSEQADDWSRRHRAFEFQVVWVGTGDTRGARSSFPGDGVYKSVDAARRGRIWNSTTRPHLARRDPPANLDVVLVGVMGHLYSPNEERGVFKSTDGGKTWKRSFFVNDKLGVIYFVMNPQKPDVLYAATYGMQRTPWMSRSAGPDSAIYKTLDEAVPDSPERTAIGPHRQDRARYLREESGDPLRGAGQRQPRCLAWHAWRMYRWSASRARGRRPVLHRLRWRELEKSQFGR